MNFTPFPEIKTERLLLRRIKELDCEAFLFLRSDKEVNKYIERSEDKIVRNISDAIKLIRELNEFIVTNKSIDWGITLKNDPKLIGTICLWNFSNDKKTAEVGYSLDPKFQRKGIMSESMKMIIDFGFKELKLDRIEAFTHAENERSKKLLVKNGFRLNENREDVDNKFNIIFEIANGDS